MKHGEAKMQRVKSVHTRLNLKGRRIDQILLPGSLLAPLGLLKASWSVLRSDFDHNFGILLGPSRPRAVPNFFLSAPEASKSAPRGSPEAF